MASCIASVRLSAYMMTCPFTLRAARPAVCVKALSLRRNPSLSASMMDTSDTSGRSSPSRSKFTPMSTSNEPARRSSRIWMRSSVSTSEWMYRLRMPIRSKYFDSSSAMRLVSVVTSTRSPFSARSCISSTRSSI